MGNVTGPYQRGPSLPWTDEKRNRVVELFQAGKSYSQIASILTSRDFAPSRAAISGILCRAGVKHASVAAKRAKQQGPAKVPITFGKRLSATDSKDAYAKRMASIQSEHDARMERIDAEAPTDGSGVTLVDLKYGQCKWPLGDPLSSRFRFCGGNTSGNTYCPHHARMAYVPRVAKK